MSQSPNNSWDAIDKVLGIVNDAVTTGNYTSMAKNIGDLIKPLTSEQLQRDARNRYPGSKYNAGHMSGPGYGSYGGSTGSSAWRQNASYGQNTAYGQNASYGQNTAYGQNASYGQNAAYGQNASYGQSATYGQNASYGQSATYGQNAAGVHSGSTAGTNVRGNVHGAVTPAAADPYFGTPSSMPGKLLFGFGIAGVVILLIPAILGIWGVAAGGIGRVIGTIPLVLAGGCALGAFAGSRMSAAANRFARYRAVLGTKMYADVSELASAVGRSEKKTVKDLKKMTAEGWFRQGHLDAQEKTFVATNALYGQYQATAINAEALKKAKAEEDKKDAGLSEDVRQILDKGNAYISHIHSANDAIPDEEVSDKLSRMENIVTKIFAQVRRQPSLAKNLNMFMDYYLPTTAKLIDAYVEMEGQPVQGENIRSAKREIEGSLDTINDAFENLLDSFFKDKALDVSTDISVMKTMMKQQGLTPDDLEAMRRKQAAMEKGPTLEELKKQINASEKEKAEALKN